MSGRKFLRPGRPPNGGTGLARTLSKLGYCSRSQAWELIRARRVAVNGILCADPERRVQVGRDRIEVDGTSLRAAAKVYLMLNKPRGLVTTAADEHGRQTVFACLADKNLPFVSPVGRLDQASEGLLLFTNDSAWAAHITNPAARVPKTYHVQIDRVADEVLARQIQTGVTVDGDHLAARSVSLLRHGTRTSWLEVVLEEGKNRHLRRLLGSLGINVLRLVRVAIGPLRLGSLGKGQVRELSAHEISALRPDKIGQKSKR